MRAGLLIAVVLLAACVASEPQQSSAEPVAGFTPDARPLGRTLVYECNAYDFIARLGPGEMAIWLEDRYVILSQVRSASGVHYQEGDISFWMKGDEAMLAVGGNHYSNCHLNPRRAPWEDARRRRVDFRAVGNEPGWHLEVQLGRQLLFVADYGMQRILLENPVEEVEGSFRRYLAGKGLQALVAEVLDEPCADTMSGDRYPNRVRVLFKDKLFEGCGMDLSYPWVE